MAFACFVKVHWPAAAELYYIITWLMAGREESESVVVLSSGAGRLTAREREKRANQLSLSPSSSSSSSLYRRARHIDPILYE